MKRELLLMRHGKAERFDGDEDYDRRLKKRGKKDALRMGKWLKEQGLLPDLIISSPAARAQMTARLVGESLGFNRAVIQLEKRLYDEGWVRVKSILVESPAHFKRVLVVGHNPELEDLLRHLVDSAAIPVVEKLLPTSAIAQLTLPEDWTRLEKGCATLICLISPKSLTE